MKNRIRIIGLVMTVASFIPNAEPFAMMSTKTALLLSRLGSLDTNMCYTCINKSHSSIAPSGEFVLMLT